MKATPQMLLKTNVEKMSPWGMAAMFMKSKDIQADTCDVYENAGDIASHGIGTKKSLGYDAAPICR
jgi:hypothetical protein